MSISHKQTEPATVIGGGLLGLEADIVHLTSYIMDQQLDAMDQQLDASSGAMLKVLLEDMGVRFHLEKMTTSIHGNGRVSGIGFRDGGTLDARCW